VAAKVKAEVEVELSLDQPTWLPFSEAIERNEAYEPFQQPVTEIA